MTKIRLKIFRAKLTIVGAYKEKMIFVFYFVHVALFTNSLFTGRTVIPSGFNRQIV